jgi:hypothetical protein
MEDHSIVVATLGEVNEILGGLWRFVFKEFKTNCSLVSFNDCGAICHVVSFI